MKEEKRSYIGGLLHGIGTLLTGMKITGRDAVNSSPKLMDTASIPSSPRESTQTELSSILIRMPFASSG